MKKLKSLLFLSLVMSLIVSCNNDTSSNTTSDNTSNSNYLTTTTTATSDPSSTTSVEDPTPIDPKEEITQQEVEEKVTLGTEKTSVNVVGSGSYIFTETYGQSTSTENTTYSYGVDDDTGLGELYAHTVSSYSTDDIYVFKDYVSDEIITVNVDSSGKITKPYISYTSINPMFTSINGYSNRYFGVASLVSTFFELSKTNINKDAKYYKQGNKYIFTQGYFTSLESYNFYEITFEFELGTQNELKTVNVTSNSYNSSSFTVDIERNTISINEGATPSNIITYNISQNLLVGEWQDVCPYSLSDFYASSFDMTYNEESLSDGSEINVEQGQSGTIKFTNILPTTTSFDFDTVKIDTKAQDSSNTTNIEGYFSTYNNLCYIYTTDAELGKYDVTISTKNITKTLVVNVVAAQPQSFSLSYHTKGVNNTYNDMSVSENITTFTNVDIILDVSVYPSEADQSFTYKILKDNNETTDATITKENLNVSEYVGAKDYYVFKTSVAGTYTVTFTSTALNSVVKTINIEVREFINMKTYLSSTAFGYKSSNDIRYLLTFTPTDDNNGSVEIQNETQKGVYSYQCVYSTTTNDYTFNLTYTSGDNFSLNVKMGLDYNLVIVEHVTEYDYYNYYVLEEATPLFYTSGMWEGKDNSSGYTLELYLYTTGEAMISLHDEQYSVSEYISCKYTLTSSTGGYTITILESQYTEDDAFLTLPLSATINSTYTAISISITYNSTNYLFNLSRMQ